MIRTCFMKFLVVYKFTKYICASYNGNKSPYIRVINVNTRKRVLVLRVYFKSHITLCLNCVLGTKTWSTGNFPKINSWDGRHWVSGWHVHCKTQFEMYKAAWFKLSCTLWCFGCVYVHMHTWQIGTLSKL